MAKVQDATYLIPFAGAEIVAGVGGVAVVNHPTAGHYLVIACDQRAVDGYACKLRKQLQKLPQDPGVEWIRPLTRQMQCLFGWGDVHATREDVERACDSSDAEKLKALLPQATALIRQGRWEQLPALHDALRQEAPALQDCFHDFFSTPGRFPGPCANNANHSGRHGFFKCRHCPKQLCKPCAGDAEVQVNRAKALHRTLHDVNHEHTWSKEPNEKSVCERCERGAPYECECGARLCRTCLSPPPADPFAPTTTYWRTHPTVPRPFYVIDHKKLRDETKLEWLRAELGDNEDIAAFARKYLELFGDLVHGSYVQRSACLKLFAAYVPKGSAEAAWHTEKNIPPADLHNFERVWDPKAPKRCLECSKKIEGAGVREGRYCAEACAGAGRKTICRTCNKALDPIHPYCTECKRGAPRLGKRSAQADMLSLAQRMWFGGAESKDPEHVPAWKKRRRS